MKTLTLVSLFTLATCSLSAAEKTKLLFDGKDFAGWRQPTGAWMAAKAVSLDPADPTKFVVQPGKGIMVNGPKFKTVNITTEAEFGDAQIHIEFCISKHSNSGIYIMAVTSFRYSTASVWRRTSIRASSAAGFIRDG